MLEEGETFRLDPGRACRRARALDSVLHPTRKARQVTIAQEGMAAAWPCLRVLTVKASSVH